MSEDETRKHQAIEPHTGPDHQAPYPVSRLAPAIDLVDMARQIARADQMVNARVSAKLQVIVDQIRNLQAEARTVLADASQDQALHRARCTFKRRPGHLYHLYRKPDGTLYFSMLSPADWQHRPPDEFAGSYRLEADQSWTPEAEMDQPDETRRLVEWLLDEHQGGPSKT